MIDPRTCDTCHWWHLLDPDGEGVEADGGYKVSDVGTGRCRRYPPKLRRGPNFETDSSDAAGAAIWPITWDEDWCGEHRPVTVAALPTSTNGGTNGPI